MRQREFIGRFLLYSRRHGLVSTARRIGLAVKRTVAQNRLVLFYCDLAALDGAALKLTQGRVERRSSESELDSTEINQLLSVGYPAAVRRQTAERFGLGASLWLFRLGPKLAGYGWTLVGKTVEPYFFPLGSGDVHLFDFFVFPEFRGRGINRLLVLEILNRLAAEKKARAFIETAEWNTAQLRSLGRMPFKRLGVARKFGAFGRTFAVWQRFLWPTPGTDETKTVGPSCSLAVSSTTSIGAQGPAIQGTLTELNHG
jgi:ribosomal protein S18 acetylase RimI-like enzyme